MSTGRVADRHRHRWWQLLWSERHGVAAERQQCRHRDGGADRDVGCAPNDKRERSIKTQPILQQHDANSTFLPLELQASSFDFTVGNVGIGMTSPIAVFDVTANGASGNAQTTAGLRIDDGTSDTALLAGVDNSAHIAHIQTVQPNINWAPILYVLLPNDGVV